MNYIRHLNGFFERLAKDGRLSSYHISLYMALFQHWNANRFSDQFTISRAEVMKLARIGSANTYARCMKELTGWGYISYLPSSNLHSGSKVACIRFDITGDTADDTGIKNDTGTDTAGKTATDTGAENDTTSDTARITATDTGTSGNLKTDTGAGTAGDTGIQCDTTTNTGDDKASGTGTIAGTENDIGRSAANRKNEPGGIKPDTGTDTASDTLLINITNKNKQEEESSKRNSEEKVSEDKKEGEEEIRKRDGELKIQIPGIETIRNFFEQNQSSGDDAQKFYTHYQSSGWKTGDMKTIVSWQALARKWIINNKNNKTDEQIFNQVRTGNLNVAVNKNYDEPL